MGRDSEFVNFNIPDLNMNLLDVRAILVDGQDVFVPVIPARIVLDVEIEEEER